VKETESCNKKNWALAAPPTHIGGEMRRSTKPFVVEHKKRWQSKREVGPLFTRNELLLAESEPPLKKMSVAPALRNVAVPDLAPARRILLDLTPVSDGPEPNVAYRHRISLAEATDTPPGVPVGSLVISDDPVKGDPPTVRSGPLPARDEPVAQVALGRSERNKADAPAKSQRQERERRMPSQKNLSRMNLDELVEMRDQIQQAIEKKVAQEREELQKRMDALPRLPCGG
jgi:hypothetical protein